MRQGIGVAFDRHGGERGAGGGMLRQGIMLAWYRHGRRRGGGGGGGRRRVVRTHGCSGGKG